MNVWINKLLRSIFVIALMCCNCSAEKYQSEDFFELATGDVGDDRLTKMIIRFLNDLEDGSIRDDVLNNTLNGITEIPNTGTELYDRGKRFLSMVYISESVFVKAQIISGLRNDDIELFNKYEVVYSIDQVKIEDTPIGLLREKIRRTLFDPGNIIIPLKSDSIPNEKNIVNVEIKGNVLVKSQNKLIFSKPFYLNTQCPRHHK